MLSLLDHHFLFGLLFVVVAGGTAIAIFGERLQSFWLRGVDLVRPGEGLRRRCQYCFLGRAHLHEESVRIDGDDLVEVRCWVCRGCGLPQWTVERTAVMKKAA